MAIGERHDPLLQGFFQLDIASAGVSCIFSEASGFGVSVDVAEYRAQDAQGKPILQKQPGMKKYNDITLRRGFSKDTTIWDWVNKVLDGKIDQNRVDGTLTLKDQSGAPQMSWHFKNAWPTKLMGPTSLSAKSSEIAIEELTLAIEDLIRDKG